MAISQEGHLIVTERDDSCITIINTTSGEVINRFGQYGSGQIEFDYPNGLSMTQDGHIVVADYDNHRLQVLTVEGAFVAAVGSEGSQPLQFNYPFDVAIHHNGKIFVTERLNNRVQVLNPDLSYSHCFGSKGDKPGELQYPRGIAIDRDGMAAGYTFDTTAPTLTDYTLDLDTDTLILTFSEVVDPETFVFSEITLNGNMAGARD